MKEEFTEIKTVDLNFEVYTDHEEKAVIFKFTNFEDKKQMEKFKKYMVDNLPLILFTSDVQH